MQLALMVATTGIDLLLSQSIALIGLLNVALHLNLKGFLTENIVSVMVSPSHELRGGALATLQHIA